MSKMKSKRTTPNAIKRQAKNPKSRIDFDLPDDTKEISRNKRTKLMDDEDISEGSNEDMDKSLESDSEDDFEEETADAKRVRLAREYLENMKRDSDDSSDDDDESTESSDMNHHDPLGRKLERERLKNENTLERPLADFTASFLDDVASSSPRLLQGNNEEKAKSWITSEHVKYYRGHDLTPTCVALQKSSDFAFSGSKDNSVIMWDIQNECKKQIILPQWKDTDRDQDKNKGEVLAMECSDDGRYLVVGGRDCLVKVFDIRSGNSTSNHKPVMQFKGHTGAITSLGFRSHSLELFSGSEDRCLRHYNLDQMLFLETLYGHQAPVTSITCHLKAKPISVSRDRTARSWKITEESHLIFRGGSSVGSADCANIIKEDWFLTGHEGGELLLWNAEKKRPVSTVVNAHPSGIVSCGTVKGSDLAITGSNDGYMRFWKVQVGKGIDTRRAITPVAKIPVHGYINQIAVDDKARFCVAAVGQEHRLGRWDRVARAKNRFAVIPMIKEDINEDNDTGDNSEDDESHHSDDTGKSRDSGNVDQPDGIEGGDTGENNDDSDSE